MSSRINTSDNVVVPNVSREMGPGEILWYQNTSEELGFGIENTPTANNMIHLCLGLTIVLTGLIGAIGNGTVIYVLTRYQRLRISGGPLILSLATSDLLVSILHVMPAYSSYYGVWKFGKFGCEIYAGTVGLGGLVSIITLSAIAADRYSVIFGKPLDWIPTKKTCYLIWFLSFFIILPPYLGWSRYTLEGMGTSCTWDYLDHSIPNRLYYLFLLFFGFLGPVAIIIYSYTGILRLVSHQSKFLRNFDDDKDKEILGEVESPVNGADLKAAKVVFTLILCFLISWTPYTVISFIGQFGPPHSLSKLTTSLPAIFAKSSVIYNPIIYGLSHPAFRHVIRTILYNNCVNGTYDLDLERTRRQSYFPVATNNNPRESLKFLNNNTTTEVSRGSLQVPPIIPTIIYGQRGHHSHRNSNVSTSSTSCGGGIFRENPTSFQYGPRGSRNSQDILLSKASWRVIEKQRKFSSIDPIIMNWKRNGFKGPGSNYYGHSPQQEEQQLLDRSSNNFSEPELHRRFDERIIKDAQLISLSDYQHKKKNFLWKTLFRSENCLIEQFLKSKDFVGSCTSKQKQRRVISPYEQPQKFRSKRHTTTKPTDLRIKITKSDSDESAQFGTPKGGSPLHEATIEAILRENAKDRGFRSDSECEKKTLSPILVKRNSSDGSHHHTHNTVRLQTESTERLPATRKSSRESTNSTLSTNTRSRRSSSRTSGSGGHIKLLLDGNHRKSSGSSDAASSHYYRCRTGSKKSSSSSFGSAGMSKNQWKYNLIHQRDCCECSYRLSSSCPQDRHYFSSADNNDI